jgi:UDP-N-acetylglucosamine:LPS N-acetylglucosamine transferase
VRDAAEDHQMRNARAFAERTGAIIADSASVAARVDDLLQLQPRRFLSMIAAMINRNATRRRV